MNLITSTTLTSESHRTQHSGGLVSHECKIVTSLKCRHGLFGRSIGTGLADDVAKAPRREVGPEHNKAIGIESHKARVSENGVPQVIHSELGGISPNWSHWVQIVVVGNQLMQRGHT